MEKNELFAVFDEPPGESAVSGESERFSGNGPGEVAGVDQAALFEGAADRVVDAGNHPAVHAVSVTVRTSSCGMSRFGTESKTAFEISVCFEARSSVQMNCFGSSMRFSSAS